MKTTICLVMLIFTVLSTLSGCATVSEYNKGCRDAMANILVNGVGQLGTPEVQEQYCNGLTTQYEDEKQHSDVMNYPF